MRLRNKDFHIDPVASLPLCLRSNISFFLINELQNTIMHAGFSAFR